MWPGGGTVVRAQVLQLNDLDRLLRRRRREHNLLDDPGHLARGAGGVRADERDPWCEGARLFVREAQRVLGGLSVGLVADARLWLPVMFGCPWSLHAWVAASSNATTIAWCTGWNLQPGMALITSWCSSQSWICPPMVTGSVSVSKNRVARRTANKLPTRLNDRPAVSLPASGPSADQVSPPRHEAHQSAHRGDPHLASVCCIALFRMMASGAVWVSA